MHKHKKILNQVVILQNQIYIQIFYLSRDCFQIIKYYFCKWLYSILGFPGGLVVKNPPANAGADAGDTDSIPGSGRCLEKEMDTLSTILA